MAVRSTKPSIACHQDTTRRLVVALILIVGIVASVAAAFTLMAKRNQDVAARFDRGTTDRFTAITDHWSRALEKIQTAAIYVEADALLDTKEFESFTKRILGPDQDVMDVQWIIRKVGDSSPEAGTRDAGAFVTAQGIDLTSIPECREAMARSCDTASVSITPLLQGFEGRLEATVIAVFPIYTRGQPAPPPEERRIRLLGHVVGIIRADAIVVQALSRLGAIGIDTGVIDITDATNPVALGLHPSRTRPPQERATLMTRWPPENSPFRRDMKFAFGNRNYEIQYAVAPAFFHDYPSWHHWLVLGGGSVLTVLAALYTNAFSKRSEQIRQLVAQRTNELDALNCQLQATSAVQSAILNSANVAIISSDTNGTIRTFNAGAERLLGYAASELVGIHTPAIFHKADEIKARAEELSKGLGFPVTPGFESFVARARLSIGDSHEWTYIRKDGTTFPSLLSVSAIRDENGQVTGFLGIAHDLTERRKAEEDLRKLWRAVEQSPATVVITDLTGTIEYVNPKFEEVTGYTAAEALGKNPRILKSEGHDPEFYTKMWNTLVAGNIWKGELRNRKKNGESIWESAAIAPIRNGQGIITNYVAIKEDITEQRKIAEDLRRALDAAQQANLAKSSFLANVSHELRTPLNGVIGMSELLLSTSLDRKQREFVEACHNSATALLALINDILDFSKIEAGKMELSPHDFDLERIIHQSVTMVAPRVHEKGLALDVSIAPELCTQVFGDGERLRQILVNLLSNAVKFTQQGSVSVALTAEAHSEQRWLIRCAVRDTGIGIPQEQMKHLFLPFSQVDSSPTRRFGGTGLGLAISRNLAVAMEGQMGIESTEGQGSTFWFTVLLGVAQNARVSRHSDLAGLRSMRIMFLDASPLRCMNLGDHLAHWGFQFDAAPNLTQARDLLQQAFAKGTLHTVVCLEGGSNNAQVLALLEWMQVKFGTSAPHVLLFTPFGQDPEPEVMRRLNIADCLTSPVLPFMFLRALTEIHKNRTNRQANLAPATPSQVTASFARQVRAHVLIAEDNPVNQLVAAEMVRRAGFTCDVVSNGALALEAMRAKPYDLVLMDGQMPTLDGYEATRQIRTGERESTCKKHTPIIALTASAVKGDRERCLAAGMDDYITKPFESRVLISKIQEALRHSVPAAAPAESPATGSPGLAPTSSAPIDAQELLSRCMGDISFLGQMLDMFKDESAKTVERLAAAIEQRDFQKLASDAHALKGAAGSVGARTLQAIAAKLETLGLAGELPCLEKEIKSLRDEVERCVASVPSILGSFREKHGGATAGIDRSKAS